MITKLSAALAALVTILGATLFNAGNASAWGYESLGCRFNTASSPEFTQYCQNDQPTMYEYNIVFLVQNETGPSTYSWSVPAGYRHDGCTSTDNWCGVRTDPGQQDIYVSVTLTQGGNSNYLTAQAHIEPFCGSMYC